MCVCASLGGDEGFLVLRLEEATTSGCAFLALAVAVAEAEFVGGGGGEEGGLWVCVCVYVYGGVSGCMYVRCCRR